jgi:hypothetical protein
MDRARSDLKEDLAMTKKAFVIAGLIAVLGGIHLATLRDGQEWNDFSLYVAHARNIAEGRPYADTGYVYNPADPVLSPRTYPPIFPLLLVPVYLIWGMNLTAMKVWVVLLFMALLGVLACLFQKRLPFPYVLGCLVLFGLNPSVWQQKDRLLSETPFMLFAYLSLVLAEKAQEEASRRRAAIWGLFSGLAAYLAFGTRTVGVVLVPSVLLYDWLRRRRLGTASVAITAAFLAGVIAQKCLLMVEGSYLDQLVFDPILYARIAQSRVRAFGYYWENGYNDRVRLVLYACLLAPVCWAWLARQRDAAGESTVLRALRGLTSYELFAAFNGLILVLWPAAEYNRRFLLPILPLFFLWVAEGLHRLDALSLRRLEKPLAAALALAVLLSYLARYSSMNIGPISDGVGTPEAVALFEWVQKQTDADDVFLFPRPRAFALYTRRRSLAHHAADDVQRLALTLQKHGVTHLVVYHSSPFPVFQKSGRLVETLIAEEPSGFDKLYENPAFRVYRLRQGALASRRDCQPSGQSRN